MNEKELAELDLAVAKAEGLEDAQNSAIGCVYRKHKGADYRPYYQYQPTRDPAEAMRLLEKYVFDLRHDSVDWCACHNTRERLVGGYGPTPAIAICRATVALKQK